MTSAVIGVRDLSGHSGTGRAAVVRLGRPDKPRGAPAIERRRDVALVPDDLPARVYHECADLPPAQATALVARIERTAQAAALDLLAESITRPAGDDPVLALPIDDSETHDLPAVVDIVASHSLMHVAETALYREAILAAAEQHGIAVHRYEPATVATRLAQLTGLGPAAVDEQLAEWGRVVGRPWRREHKQAALGAWLTAVVLSAR